MHRDGDTPRPRRDAETSRHRGSVASDIKIANGGKRALRGRKTASDLLPSSARHQCQGSSVMPPTTEPQRFKTFPKSATRSEEHTSELQSLMRISYAVFCLKKKNN